MEADISRNLSRNRPRRTCAGVYHGWWSAHAPGFPALGGSPARLRAFPGIRRVLSLKKAHRLLLGLILIGWLAGSLRTMLATPLYRGPDESQHLQYVRHLAEGYGLPVMRMPPEANAASQEGAQPPVYYAIVAALTFWTDAPTFAGRLAAGLDKVLAVTHRIGWTHPLDAAFFDAPRNLMPTTSLVSGYAARLPSLAFGLVALALLFAVLRALTGDVWSALAGTAWLGWNANFAFIHAFVTPDALLALLSTAALWLLLLALHRELSDRQALTLGLLLSVLVLTKLNGLALVASAALALPLMPKAGSRRWRVVVLVCLVLILGTGWWFIRNWMLYGEPTGLRMMAAIEGAKGGTDPQTLTVPRVGGLLLRGYRSFASPPLHLFDLLAALGLGGALLGLASPRWRRPVLFLGATLVFGLAPFVLWANTFVYGWHARLFLPVWPAVAGLWAIGFTVLVPPRVRPIVTASLIVILGSQWTLRVQARQSAPQPSNAYYFLPVVAEHERSNLSDAPIARVGDALLLRRVEVTSRLEDGPAHPVTGAGGPQPRPSTRAENLYVVLIWETVGGIRDRDTAFFVHLIAPDGTRVGQVDTYHEVDTPPLVAWPLGQMVVHLNRLRVPADYAGQPLTIHLGVYNKRTGERWPIWVTGEVEARDRLEVPVAGHAGGW